MTRAAVGLGSNLGDRVSFLRLAVEGLARLGTVLEASSVYQTAPIGPVPQGAFLNAVVTLETDLEAAELLAGLQRIEQEAGRERVVAQGPRTLDLDLLIFGWAEIATSSLTVPHPDLTDRRFVLEPLLEVWPEVIIPGRGPAAGFLEAVASQEVAPTTHRIR